MIRFALAMMAIFCTVPSSPAQDLSPSELHERAIHRRAVEAVIWGMPAVNFELMYQAAVQAGSNENHIVYWSRIPTGRTRR